VDDGFGRPACRLFHPSDPISAFRCTELMATVEGLCYLRTHRPDAPFLYPLDERFDVDGFKPLRKGNHLTLAGSGYIVHSLLAAASTLSAEGITCNVFDCYAFPLDAGPILAAAKSAGGAILVVEDNYAGGLHSELAEAAAEGGEIRVVGVTARRIPKSAKTAAEVFSHVGVGAAYILEKARALARR